MFGRMILLIAAFMPVGLSATMDPAQWRRVMLVGVDQDSYYTFEVNRSQPGSYYVINKSVNFLIYDRRSGTLKKTIPIRKETLERDPEKDDWNLKKEALKSADIARYYKSTAFRWLFPEDDFVIPELAVEESGMTLFSHGKSRLVKYKVAPKLLFSMDYQGDAAKVISVYMDGENIYIHAQRGSAADDTNFIQEILLVKTSEFLAVKKELDR